MIILVSMTLNSLVEAMLEISKIEINIATIEISKLLVKKSFSADVFAFLII